MATGFTTNLTGLRKYAAGYVSSTLHISFLPCREQEVTGYKVTGKIAACNL